VAGTACNPSRAYLFSTLCKLVQVAGLEDILNDPDGTFTVFGPTNMAFEGLPDEISDALSDVDLLRDVLLFHTVAGQDVRKSQLEDGDEVTMANGGTTTTSKPSGCKIYQSGPGNDASNLPRIIIPDVVASNGVIHAVDEVLLPQL